MIILVGWENLASGAARFFTVVPGSVVVVALGIALNQVFRLVAPTLYISEPQHLVDLPVPQSFVDLVSQFSVPNFAVVADPGFWGISLTLAIVASLESLLSLEAADRIDPYKRISPPSRELWAQGAGNVVSGFLGGLPITSVVLRTSANVQAGGRTWKAAFVHGALLLASALLIPQLLNQIPLASLAAILIMVGYKLTKPSVYQSVYRMGMTQFIPFFVTVMAIVFTDLLKGVVLGLVCGLFFVLRSNHRDAVTVVSRDNAHLIRLNKEATFLNKNELRTKLRAIERGVCIPQLQSDAHKARTGLENPHVECGNCPTVGHGLRKGDQPRLKDIPRIDRRGNFAQCVAIKNGGLFIFVSHPCELEGQAVMVNAMEDIMLATLGSMVVDLVNGRSTSNYTRLNKFIGGLLREAKPEELDTTAESAEEMRKYR